MTPPSLVLASASPRRRALLEQLGILLEVDPPHIDERLLPGESAGAYVLRLAREKARAVSDRNELLAKLRVDAKSGDSILVMGARDPSLPALVRRIVELFGGRRSNG